MEKVKEDTLHNLRILYVEDEEFTRNEMKRFLSRRIGKLYLAENGARGLEIYKEHKPDVVIADLVMPVMGGLEMIRHIRELDENCFIIITSAKEDVNSILETVDIGIVKYILKPINTEKLVEAIRDISNKIIKKDRLKFLLDKKRKKEIEDNIKRGISHFIKKSTGKGPRDVSVFIQGTKIEVKAYDTLTCFEKSMLDKNKNTKIVEQNRKLFYSIQKDIIEKMISDIVKSNVEVTKVTTDSLINKDIIQLSII